MKKSGLFLRLLEALDTLLRDDADMLHIPAGEDGVDGVKKVATYFRCARVRVLRIH